MSAKGIRSQSLVFTLFGDYIRHHGARIWIGSLIKLLALFDISEQATRSTVSRMVRRGWLKIVRERNTSYYTLTPAAQKIIAEGAQRIFDFPLPEEKWNGCWQLVIYSIPEERRDARDCFRGELASLGYGMLTNAVWVSPRDHRARVQQSANSLNIQPYVQIFNGQLGGLTSCRELITRCWNLGAINAEYADFITQYELVFKDFSRRLDAGEKIADSEYFVRRFMLIHEYRRFPFRDPHLPVELLPPDWQGQQATNLFQKYHQLLAAGANRYFESVFR